MSEAAGFLLMGAAAIIIAGAGIFTRKTGLFYNPSRDEGEKIAEGRGEDFLLGDNGLDELAYIHKDLDSKIIKNDPAKLDPKRLLDHVDSRLRRLMIEAHKDSPLNFRITHGLRTPEEQQTLYNQGRTTAGKIVTNTLESKHLTGLAVDIYVTPSAGRKPWDERDFKIVGEHVKMKAEQLGIPIRWGGDFRSFKDYPHYEIYERGLA